MQKKKEDNSIFSKSCFLTPEHSSKRIECLHDKVYVKAKKQDRFNLLIMVKELNSNSVSSGNQREK